MPVTALRTRTDLDYIVDEIEHKLEQLYRLSNSASHAETWASLTSAALKLAAPEDQDYLYERLYAVYQASHASSPLAQVASA